MKIKKAVAVLTAIKFQTASKWTTDRMETKLNRLFNNLTKAEVDAVTDPATKAQLVASAPVHLLAGPAGQPPGLMARLWPAMKWGAGAALVHDVRGRVPVVVAQPVVLEGQGVGRGRAGRAVAVVQPTEGLDGFEPTLSQVIRRRKNAFHASKPNASAVVCQPDKHGTSVPTLPVIHQPDGDLVAHDEHRPAG